MIQSSSAYRKILIACVFLGIIICFNLVYFIVKSISETYRYVPKCPSIRQSHLELCPITPPHLVGEFSPDMTKEPLESVESRLANSIQPGGNYKPKNCQARDRVAIIALCRDREEQIPIFLKNLHPFLMRQQLEYQIFIVFQAHGFWFNRGALFNAGFIEASKVHSWDCFIFHDIDMVPVNDHNLYDCPRANPRHMAVDVDKFHFQLLRQNYSGGVIAMSRDQYQKINGHSNTFWGWGGEDNDLTNRIESAGYVLDRYPHGIPSHITEYITMKHTSSFPDPQWREQVRSAKNLSQTDGLNSIKYHIKEYEMKNTFTRILINFVPEEIGGNFT